MATELEGHLSKGWAVKCHVCLTDFSASLHIPKEVASKMLTGQIEVRDYFITELMEEKRGPVCNKCSSIQARCKLLEDIQWSMNEIRQQDQVAEKVVMGVVAEKWLLRLMNDVSDEQLDELNGQHVYGIACEVDKSYKPGMVIIFTDAGKSYTAGHMD